MSVGVIGVGVYLPDEVRENDWWPDNVVQGWQQKNEETKKRLCAQNSSAPQSDGQRLIQAALSELLDDPFRGSLQRRVMPQNMVTSDMEVFAAEDVLRQTGVSADEVGILLTHSSVPDYLATNVACTVHSALGLPDNCFSLSVEAACNSFQLQLAIAEPWIRSGRARYGLLIQSSGTSRILPYDKPFSAWFGDGATAVLVGPVKTQGLVGSSHRTDGTFQNTLVASVPGGKWFESGPTTLCTTDMRRAQQMFLTCADQAREVIAEALQKGKLAAEDVNFYACHQPTPWMRKVTQKYAGLSSARWLDTFRWAGSLFAANIPLVMWSAQKEGLLSDGDVVATCAAGSGVTYSSLVLQWGR